MAQTSRRMRLEIKFECFRDAEIFASSHNSIMALSQLPDEEHDSLRAFMKTVGMTQSYSFSTYGDYSCEQNTVKLSYFEDPALGLGGDTVNLCFADSRDGRDALLIERAPNPMKLMFSRGVTVNYLNLVGIRAEISTVTKKLINTLGETGGRLLIDFEMIMFGMSMYRSRLEIYAMPETKASDDTTDTAESEKPVLFYSAGRA